jgi:hypothetical protein
VAVDPDFYQPKAPSRLMPALASPSAAVAGGQPGIGRLLQRDSAASGLPTADDARERGLASAAQQCSAAASPDAALELPMARARTNQDWLLGLRTRPR